MLFCKMNASPLCEALSVRKYHNDKALSVRKYHNDS